jgi:hypothetical protein
MWTRRRIIIAVVSAVAGAAGLVTGLLVALNHGAPAKPVSAPTPAPTTQLRSPFTGEPVNALNRVLAAKIDNIVYARPQTGLTHADIVYVLPVEGGLSRFMAIFSSDFPPVIGPVRSARQDDLPLLRQFGRPAFAYSGATATLLPYIEKNARIVDLYDGITKGYFRSTDRSAPYNLYAHTKTLMQQAKNASKARDIGFRFGPPPPGGKATKSESVSYPAASFKFTWSAAKQRWLVSMDGKPAMTTDGGRLSPATVVIQHTTVRTSRFLEYGKPPPYAESTGSGPALVLRNGQAWTGHWSRPNGSNRTKFTTTSGQRMTFATGQVWVLLVSR